jgi:dephospho-CoA kinase
MTAPSKLTLGLVGGIGSGKSAVAGIMREFGGQVIDADVFGHEALTQPDIREKVIERWGQTVLDEKGEVSRRKLGGIVFADPAERKALELLVFPWITRRINEEIARANADQAVRFIVLDAAILLETGWGKACDVIVFVDAPDEIRTQRITKRHGWSAKEVEARERAQFSLEDKSARAHTTIDNAGDLTQTRKQVEKLLHRLHLI